MKATYLFLSFMLLACFSVNVLAQNQEQITITTYYPSPHGSYDELQANKLGVGDFSENGNLDTGDIPPANGQLAVARSIILKPQNPLPDTDLLYEGELIYNGLEKQLYLYTGDEGGWVQSGFWGLKDDGRNIQNINHSGGVQIVKKSSSPDLALDVLTDQGFCDQYYCTSALARFGKSEGAWSVTGETGEFTSIWADSLAIAYLSYANELKGFEIRAGDHVVEPNEDLYFSISLGTSRTIQSGIVIMDENPGWMGGNRVGIGQWEPRSQLHVNGDIQLDEYGWMGSAYLEPFKPCDTQHLGRIQFRDGHFYGCVKDDATGLPTDVRLDNI